MSSKLHDPADLPSGKTYLPEMFSVSVNVTEFLQFTNQQMHI